MLGEGILKGLAETARNAGLGSRLLQGIAADLALANAAGIIFEVEPPEDGSAEEQALRRRRIGFYQRNGARIVEGAEGYRMPDQSKPGSLRMILMWLPLDQQAEMISGQDLRDCIVSIYTEDYDREPDDPLLQSILRTLPRP